MKTLKPILFMLFQNYLIIPFIVIAILTIGFGMGVWHRSQKVDSLLITVPRLESEYLRMTEIGFVFESDTGEFYEFKKLQSKQ